MIERTATENKSYMIFCVVVKSLYTLRHLQSRHRLSHAINNLYTATLLALPKYIRLTVPAAGGAHVCCGTDVFCDGLMILALFIVG